MAMDAASLAQIESLCEIFYNQSTHSDWPSAKAQVDTMSTTPESIPQCQYILDNSQNPYAQLLASSVLKTLITTYWNNFDTAQHVTIREYLLQYLAEKGTTIPPFVLGGVIALLCRITKLGWFDDAKHRDIVSELTRFFSASVDHCIIGLKAFNLLVQELNIPIVGRTLTLHRKIAVSFRDSGLLEVAKLALEVLNQVASDSMNASAQQQTLLGEQALELFCACLGFDFIGTNPDESAEDVGTIQAPSTWRDTVQSPATIELLMLFYTSTKPPVSNVAMKALVLLSSVRRSIFLNDEARLSFLSTIMNAIGDILKKGTGLEHSENYHEFCRLLGRLKANYQLSELIADDSFLEWLELVCTFTETSFRQWQVSSNSLGYILQLWVRLVSAVPYVGESSLTSLSALQGCVLRVVVAYVESMLTSCSVCLEDDCLENPLENEELLLEQLERLSTLVRYHYTPVAEFIIGHFDPLLAEYPTLLANKANANPRLALIEAQISFLTCLCGAIVGGHKWGMGSHQSYVKEASSPSQGVERLDGMLSKRCLSIPQMTEFHSESTGALCTERLERSCLFFQINFRKTYLSDPPAPTVQTMAGNDLSDLSWDAEGGPMTAKQKGTRDMLTELGLGDQNEVTNLVMSNVFSDFRKWQSSHTVLTDAMTLFVDLASGANSSKVLVQLPCCHTLLSHHTPEHFPFLRLHENRHLRSHLHQTLAKLIFMQPTDRMETNFNAFIEPILQVLSELAALPSLGQLRVSDGRVREALQGSCRDLRGIFSAATSKKAYLMILKMLPPHLNFFSRCVEVFHDDSDVVIAMFKCLTEIVTNKSQRATFGNHSAQGILLFRDAASVVHAFASAYQATLPAGGDLYKDKYKGLACCLATIKECLSGGYVNFGVMMLYGDPSLQLALDAALKLLLSVELEDALVFPKLSRSYFLTLELLFSDHMSYMAEKDHGTFMKILEVLFGGLQCDTPISTLAAQSIDHVTTYLVLHRDNAANSAEEELTLTRLRMHMTSNPRLLPDLQSKLFELLLFGALGNHWAVTRPVLSLLIADESTFMSYRHHLVSTQSPDKQARLEECFDRLLMSLDHSLDIANRDRFAQRLANFRQQVREFLTL